VHQGKISRESILPASSSMWQMLTDELCLVQKMVLIVVIGSPKDLPFFTLTNTRFYISKNT
jgi:hypothetical protein